MKILHVSYIYPPKAGVADGITNVVQNLTAELAKRGHTVAVISSNFLDLNGNQTLQSGHYLIANISVYYLKSYFASKTFIITPKIFKFFFNNVNNYDVIHIHDCRSFQGIIASFFAKYWKIPYVFQPHGSYLSQLSDTTPKRFVKIMLDKLVSDKIVKKASKIIALTHMEAEQYSCFGISKEKIAVMPNSIDLTKYSILLSKGSFKDKIGLDNNTKIILYLGRIHKSKGIDLLINAYAYMMKKLGCNRVFLVIAGPDDGYLQEAKKLVTSLFLSDSVLFTGFISNEDKFRALIDADVFVTPSFSGFPITFLEAFVAECPIVTTSTELYWINNNVGFVVDNGIPFLAKAIFDILTDTELNTRFKKNCRIILKKFDNTTVVKQLEQIYKSAALNS